MYTHQNFEAAAVFENSGDISPLVPHPQRASPQDRTADIPEESETSYRYLFEANPQPMWIYDYETLRFLLVNDAAVRHYGYSPDEFLAMTIEDIRPEEEIPLLLKATMARPQNNGKYGVWRHRKKDGEIIDVELTIHDFRFRGKTARLSLINDITEHKRIERALQQSEQEQRQLAEHLEMERERLAEAQALAKVGSWDLNLTTNVLFWSEETYRIFGMDRTSFGASYEAFLERVHPDDRAAVNKAYTESVANRTLYAIDHRMQMPDGSIKIVHERCQTTYDADGRPIRSLGTVQDITEQKRTEEELEVRVMDRTAEIMEVNAQLVTAKQEAERANHAKSEFLSRMSHELRTPLNAILGFGQILEKQPLTPLQQESIYYILKGGQHLLGLINEILDIARVEAGHIELSLEPIALAGIVSESCALVRPLAAENSIHLDVSDTMLGGSYVLADRQRLKQVLLNLLSNGIKYNHPGGQVRVYCLPPSNDHLRLAIQDTGPGMTPKEQQRLFTPFERLNAARSGIEGTGLGLVVAQRLVHAMGGSLTFESLPAKGTTFFIDLPQAYKELTI